MSQDYYEILGVDRGADQGAIKKAYRAKAMQFHPDKNPGDKAAEERFKEAARAYEVLSDPQKRSRYDQFGEAGVNGAGGGFTDINDIFSSFGDIFGDFFGGGRPRRSRNGAQRGADLKYHIEIELKDVLKGTEKTVEFEADESCGTCHGKRAEPGSEPETCPTCEGSGQVVRSQGFFQMATPCNQCRGEGQIIRVPCRKCDGSGRQSAKRKIKVNIPAGVDDGNQLRLSGEGEGGFRSGPPGDLYVEMIVKPHKKFNRDGPHLLGELQLSYTQVLLGTELEVETLEGKETITVPRGISHGEFLSVKGQGLPSLRSGKRGDLIYEVKVQTPKKLAKGEEKLLREIAEIRGEKPSKGKKGIF